MGPVDVTAIGVWNYQNFRAREAYHAHMFYLNSVARKARKPRPKKDFSEPKKLVCDWPGCVEMTRSQSGFCGEHRSTKSRRRGAA